MPRSSPRLWKFSVAQVRKILSSVARIWIQFMDVSVFYKVKKLSELSARFEPKGLTILHTILAFDILILGGGPPVPTNLS